MSVLPARAAPANSGPVPPQIALLRLAALECRVAPRQALAACAVLDPDAGAEVYATALARALYAASDRRFVIWAPGQKELSFDEQWIAALIDAQLRGDTDSMRFLMARRVRAQARPIIALLARGLASF